MNISHPPANLSEERCHQARFLRLKNVEELVGLKKSKIYQLISERRFPKPYKVGQTSLWLANEVNAWILEACQR